MGEALIIEKIFLLLLLEKLLLIAAKEDRPAICVLLVIAKPLTKDKETLMPLKLPGPIVENRISRSLKLRFNS